MQLHECMHIYVTESPCWFPFNCQCLRQGLHVGRPQKHHHHGDQHLGHGAGRADQENMANLNHSTGSNLRFLLLFILFYLVAYTQVCCKLMDSYIPCIYILLQPGFNWKCMHGALGAFTAVSLHTKSGRVRRSTMATNQTPGLVVEQHPFPTKAWIMSQEFRIMVNVPV